MKSQFVIIREVKEDELVVEDYQRVLFPVALEKTNTEVSYSEDQIIKISYSEENSEWKPAEIPMPLSPDIPIGSDFVSENGEIDPLVISY